MQKIAQNGYTTSEVVAALEFFRGSRRIRFRYDHLDVEGNFIKDLTDKVISCSVEQKYFSDIKRTASFVLRGDADVHYLHDQIKPWVILDMHSDDRLYSDVLNEYAAYIAGRYAFNEDVGRHAINDVPVSNPYSTYDGIVGASVVMRRMGLVNGFAYSFPGASGDANAVVIANGSDIIFKRGANQQHSLTAIVWINTTDSTAQTLWRTRDSSAILALDASGNITFTLNTVGGSSINGKFTNPYGADLRMAVLTWTLGTEPKIYLNGVDAGANQIASGDIDSLLYGVQTDLMLGVNFHGTMDSYCFLNSTLDYRHIFQLWRAGIRSGPFGNKNYAEWPQGVFMLSSPTREANTANVYTRQVQGSDGIKAIADDLVPKRTPYQLGTLYLNNILGLIMNYFPDDLDYTDSQWSFDGGHYVDYKTFQLYGPTGSSYTTSAYTDYMYTISNMDFRIKFTEGVLPIRGNGNRMIRMRALADVDNRSEIAVDLSTTPATLNFQQWTGGTMVASNAIPYDTSKAYLRITEYNGYTIFQTAPDNSTWTTRLTSASNRYNVATHFIVRAEASAAEPAWFVNITNSNLIAALQKPVNITPSNKFLPTTKEYEMGTSKLLIVNDMLKSIAYEGLSIDENGYFVLKPYSSLDDLPAQWEYANDSESVMSPEIAKTLDISNIPNRWIAAASNPDSTAFYYEYTNSNPDSPTSTVSRGRTITKVVGNTDVPDLLSLQALVHKEASLDSQVWEYLEFTTAIMPFHTNRNILQITNQRLGVNAKYAETGWSFDLEPGAQMKHTARRHVTI